MKSKKRFTRASLIDPARRRHKAHITHCIAAHIPGGEGRASDAALFGEHWRDWPRRWVQKICKAAGVPEVSAHGMRGLHGTLAVDSGITSHAVASALGHESFKTTAESYAQREAVAGAQQKRVLGVLSGGKLAS